jgi:hypothetical protein
MQWEQTIVQELNEEELRELVDLLLDRLGYRVERIKTPDYTQVRLRDKNE